MTQTPPHDGFERPADPWAASGARPADRLPGHAPDAVQSLKQAMRRARFDDAERVGVLAELRATQIGRLELLQESLRPLLAQIPREVDMFDVGIMPGATPRLFIDMIGFVEMGRDARIYRFLQDTRHSRVAIAETADIPRMVEAITDYVARRLLERDKALAAEAIVEGAWRDAPTVHGPVASSSAEPRAEDRAAVSAATRESDARITSTVPTTRPARLNRLRRLAHWTALGFAFLIDLLGATVFFAALAFGVWLLWNRARGQI